MPRDMDHEIPSGVVGQEVVEAVEELVTLWFSAVEDIRPRLPPRQIRALGAVRRRPALNVSALAEHLRVGLPTASRLCDRLESAGLLRRRVQEAGDRREVRLEVTAQGHRILGDVGELLSVRLASAFAGVTPARRTRLEQVLRAVHGDLLPDRADPADSAGNDR